MTGPLLISIAKALVEIALLLLAGRCLLYLLLAGDEPRLAGNPVYRVFDLGIRPVLRGARGLLPRRFSARLVAPLAAFLLLTLWCALVLVKWQACQGAHGDSACRSSAAAAHAR
jgi:hypothetical protein